MPETSLRLHALGSRFGGTSILVACALAASTIAVFAPVRTFDFVSFDDPWYVGNPHVTTGLTLRGAWHKVVDDPVLKFFVVAVTAYGMATFEGPMLSVKSVNALSHYTDWTIGHVHSGALGWNGFMAAGFLYWVIPRFYNRELHSKRLADLHFWIGTFGILLLLRTQVAIVVPFILILALLSYGARSRRWVTPLRASVWITGWPARNS